ncbi:MAG TPA: alpha/beta fold hydrolase [Gemmatimonadaceae bacterium]|nr:alpha/beta fold hydrolase [Gemmatimonadaceae bacterium]
MTRLSLASLAACCALGVVRPAPAAAQQPEQGYITMSDSARIFYKIAGHPGPGIDTLIAIHGGPGMDLESIYNDWARGLGRRHVIIFYDQRGGGKSELPTDTSRLVAARQIQDLDEVRRHFGLTKVTLLAHSYGPLLAASYAIAHPDAVKKMVFFGPVPPRRGDFFTRYGHNIQSRLDSSQLAAMSRLDAEMTADSSSDATVRHACKDYWALGLRPRLASPAGLGVVRSDLCSTDPQGIRYGMSVANRVIMSSYGDWDLRPQLRTLDVPLLVVHGQQETIPMDLVEEWVTSMPNARLVKVPNAAHFTYAEQPALVWPVVERFLAQR